MTRAEYLFTIKKNLKLPKEIEKDALEEINTHLDEGDVSNKKLPSKFGIPEEIAKEINESRKTSFAKLFKLKSTYLILLYAFLVPLGLFFLVGLVEGMFINETPQFLNIINSLFVLPFSCLCMFVLTKSRLQAIIGSVFVFGWIGIEAGLVILVGAMMTIG